MPDTVENELKSSVFTCQTHVQKLVYSTRSPKFVVEPLKLVLCELAHILVEYQKIISPEPAPLEHESVIPAGSPGEIIITIKQRK